MNSNPGGVILQIHVLDEIFDKKDTIGLAFEINKPIYDVNINVYRCFWDNVSDKTTIRAVKEEGKYVRTASNRAARLGDAVEADPSRYEFEFKKEMIEKDFAFGFLTKDQYGTLKKHKAKEIFISGAIIDFGTISSLRFGGRYFTFKAEPYERDLSTDKWFIPELIGVPVSQILVPCPHEWANAGEKDAYTYFWESLYHAVLEANK